jgi:hypothetical protein
VLRLRHELFALLVSALAVPAMAQPVGPQPAVGGPGGPTGEARSSNPPKERGLYAEPFGTLALGRGLRFNNPYRLETPLGDDERSLSLTASYLDLGVGAAFGDPLGFRHGAVLHASFALEGVTQEVVTPSYLLVHPLFADVTGFARAGTPIVLEPDSSMGLEIGAGAVWFFSAGAGVTAELVGSMFFGAATWERDPSVIPVASLELGAWVEYEVLP